MSGDFCTEAVKSTGWRFIDGSSCGNRETGTCVLGSAVTSSFSVTAACWGFLVYLHFKMFIKICTKLLIKPEKKKYIYIYIYIYIMVQDIRPSWWFSANIRHVLWWWHHLHVSFATRTSETILFPETLAINPRHSAIIPKHGLHQRFPTCAPRSPKGSTCTSQGLRGRSRKIK
jgi:hypothetical protein